jgi:allophanate hydrolase
LSTAIGSGILPKRMADSASLPASNGPLDPVAVAEEALARFAQRGEDGVWIARTPPDRLLADARAVAARHASGESLPLFGLLFGVKDNIDVAGLPTTAACPAFAYTPAKSATVVSRLQAAGALCVGKTNLDQFATGLSGVRSPYGIPRNLFDGDYIVGGSSSGSGVAVGAGLVDFALGTDTAGSGRVPAAFNNIVGLKPGRGVLSTAGVVPACPTLDCVSIFASTVEEAARVAPGWISWATRARRRSSTGHWRG